MTAPTARQSRLLQWCYRGVNPMVYSRYGHRQWAAMLPRTRVIVKDPFAMLSIPAIVAMTGARPVLVYRHPAAVLASYRRMSWSADLAEVSAAIPEHAAWAAAAYQPAVGEPGLDSDLEALEMARFWTALNRQALADLDGVEAAIVVAHEDVASGGVPAMRRLFALADLRWAPSVERLLQDHGSRAGQQNSHPEALHNFDRTSADVAHAWRADVSESDVSVVEAVAQSTLRELDARRMMLS